MKKWIWAIIVVIVAVGVGGYSYTRYQVQAKSYSADMTAGKQAVQAKQYSQAVMDFTHASRTKANDTSAQRYLSQTQAYVDGNQALKDREFSTAKRKYTTVKNIKNGSSVLVSRAKAQLSLIKTIVAKRDSYNTKYNKALALNKANEFTDSNGVLTVLFQSKQISESYYSDIYKKAKSLQKQNNAALKALTGSTPVISNDAQSAASANTASGNAGTSDSKANRDSSSSSDANSSSSTADSNADSSTSASSGTSNYSSSQISATREELTEAGMRGSGYTDAQISAILQKAANEHISIVQAAKNSSTTGTGTTTYSQAQIQATRSELNQSGMDASNFSDDQIQTILQRAANEHTSIAQAAKMVQQ
ncbi:hypothetical protein [Lactiplantibacillus fabifermentans]|uniref:Cell surface protein n=1 Tax=Lactiplantibacillus fabifermentans T30PCM01 TaxID=1400520 RepID=W6T523_9LACO|nr:hypothetical protein [Lactiplantibacillus fabifermentans]ETY73166.1 cell surface protein [Lactiplantibacillus fabifermentans T30PCM01]